MGRTPVRFDPLRFVEEHGIVLASARSKKAPNVAEAVAGEPIRGSWWGHPRGNEIFQALGAISESSDVICLRLLEGKITFVHRRLWPALVRMQKILGPERLTAIAQEHTPSGAHRNIETPFPKWVPPETARAAKQLSMDDARALLRAVL